MWPLVKTTFTLLFVALLSSLFGQHYDRNWVLSSGDKSYVLDFYENTIRPYSFEGNESSIVTSCVSSAEGKLRLVMTIEGIYNNAGKKLYAFDCVSPVFCWPQYLLPVPGTKDSYVFIFSKEHTGLPSNLYYGRLDLLESGAAVVGEIQALGTGSYFNAAFAANMALDGSIWFYASKNGEHVTHAFHLTPQGFDNIPVPNPGVTFGVFFSSAVVSRDGQYIAVGGLIQVSPEKGKVLREVGLNVESDTNYQYPCLTESNKWVYYRKNYRVSHLQWKTAIVRLRAKYLWGKKDQEKLLSTEELVYENADAAILSTAPDGSVFIATKDRYQPKFIRISKPEVPLQELQLDEIDGLKQVMGFPRVINSRTAVVHQATACQNVSFYCRGQEISKVDWDFGDGNSLLDAGLQCVHAYSQGGTYTVKSKVHYTKGATETIEKEIYVEPCQQNSIVAQGGCPSTQLSFLLEDESQMKTVNWSFGDGHSSTSARAIHSYVSEGKYMVVATVINTDGSTETLTKEITIHPEVNTSAIQFE